MSIPPSRTLEPGSLPRSAPHIVSLDERCDLRRTGPSPTFLFLIDRCLKTGLILHRPVCTRRGVMRLSRSALFTFAILFAAMMSPAAAADDVWKSPDDLPSGIPSLSCTTFSWRLCLVGGRYAFDLAAWNGGFHRATAWNLSDRSGYFTLPFATGGVNLPEVVVKMLPEGAFGQSGAPVFYSSLTTLRWVLTVTDTVTGLQKTYRSNEAAPFCGGADFPFASE